MKFKISEVSKMTGFSPSGVRFFEEAGVISPARGKNKKYREFSLTDVQSLLVVKQYRECGLSLHQSLEMLKNSSIQGIYSHLTSQVGCLRHELTRKQLLLEYLENKKEDLATIDTTVQSFKRVRLPSLYLLRLWQPGNQDGQFTPFDMVFEWLERSPLVNSCLLLPLEAFLSGEGDLQTRWGVAIEEAHALQLGFSPAAPYQIIPAQDCIRVLVKINEDLTISSAQLNAVRAYLIENHVKPVGPAVSRFFYNLNEDQESFDRYDFLYIPAA